MKNLYIAGAGGCGRELVGMLADSVKIRGARWNIKGFLDDTNPDIGEMARQYPVVGTIADFRPGPDDVVMLGIAKPEAKEKVATLLKARGVVFESFIHPYAALGHFNSLGEGVVIYGGFGMTVNVTIGNFVTLQACYLGHDVVVDDFATISSFSNLMGQVRIGRKAFLGSSVAASPNLRVGEGAFVCVGSILIRDVAPGAKVMGNPAREIG